MGQVNCYECQHRANLPGDTHSKCMHPKVQDVADNPLAALMSMMGGRGIGVPPSVGAQLGIKGNPHGIQKGWFNWPINFDPIWLENCNGFEPIEDEGGDTNVVE